MPPRDVLINCDRKSGKDKEGCSSEVIPTHLHSPFPCYFTHCSSHVTPIPYYSPVLTRLHSLHQPHVSFLITWCKYSVFPIISTIFPGLHLLPSFFPSGRIISLFPSRQTSHRPPSPSLFRLLHSCSFQLVPTLFLCHVAFIVHSLPAVVVHLTRECLECYVVHVHF